MSTLLPIFALTPFSTSHAPGVCLRAVVTLSWPYSASTRQCALLLAEEDFRLRNRGGQVRVRFAGTAAAAVSKSRVGIADVVVIALDGAKWIDRDGSKRTPGKSVEAELQYEDVLSMKIERSGGGVDEVVVEVDRGKSVNTKENMQMDDDLATPAPKGKTDLRASFGAGFGSAEVYKSPAFLRNAGALNDRVTDSFTEDLDAEKGSRKRVRVSFGEVRDWRFAGRTPSPSKADETDIGDIAEVTEERDMKSTGGLIGAGDAAVRQTHTEPDEPAASALHGRRAHTPAMPPPPFPRLQMPSSSPVAADFEQHERKDDPSTPRLHPVSATGLPLPSPFPNGPTQSLIPSTSAESIDSLRDQSMTAISPQEAASTSFIGSDESDSTSAHADTVEREDDQDRLQDIQRVTAQDQHDDSSNKEPALLDFQIPAGYVQSRERERTSEGGEEEDGSDAFLDENDAEEVYDAEDLSGIEPSDDETGMDVAEEDDDEADEILPEEEFGSGREESEVEDAATTVPETKPRPAEHAKTSSPMYTSQTGFDGTSDNDLLRDVQVPISDQHVRPTTASVSAPDSQQLARQHAGPPKEQNDAMKQTLKSLFGFRSSISPQKEPEPALAEQHGDKRLSAFDIARLGFADDESEPDQVGMDEDSQVLEGEYLRKAEQETRHEPSIESPALGLVELDQSSDDEDHQAGLRQHIALDETLERPMAVTELQDESVLGPSTFVHIQEQDLRPQSNQTSIEGLTGADVDGVGKPLSTHPKDSSPAATHQVPAVPDQSSSADQHHSTTESLNPNEQSKLFEDEVDGSTAIVDVKLEDVPLHAPASTVQFDFAAEKAPTDRASRPASVMSSFQSLQSTPLQHETPGGQPLQNIEMLDLSRTEAEGLHSPSQALVSQLPDSQVTLKPVAKQSIADSDSVPTTLISESSRPPTRDDIPESSPFGARADQVRQVVAELRSEMQPSPTGQSTGIDGVLQVPQNAEPWALYSPHASSVVDGARPAGTEVSASPLLRSSNPDIADLVSPSPDEPESNGVTTEELTTSETKTRELQPEAQGSLLDRPEPQYPSLPLSPSATQSAPIETQLAFTESAKLVLPLTPLPTQQRHARQSQSTGTEVSSQEVIQPVQQGAAAVEIVSKPQDKSSMESWSHEGIRGDRQDDIGPPPSPGPRTPPRRSLRSRLSHVPDVISSWFTPKKSNGYASSAKDDVEVDSTVTSKEKLIEAEAPSKATTSASGISHRANGVNTPHGYFTSLAGLERHLNPSSQQAYGSNTVDVLAVVTDQTKSPARAKGGPKDFFTVLRINDETLDDKATVQVEVFRPWKAFLPVANVGDVVLLRGFTVKSRNRMPYLLSTDESAWCAWRFSQQREKAVESEKENRPLWSLRRSEHDVREEVHGPPVEFGEHERQQAASLREWWVSQQVGRHVVDEDMDDESAGEVTVLQTLTAET